MGYQFKEFHGHKHIKFNTDFKQVKEKASRIIITEKERATEKQVIKPQFNEKGKRKKLYGDVAELGKGRSVNTSLP